MITLELKITEKKLIEAIIDKIFFENEYEQEIYNKIQEKIFNFIDEDKKVNETLKKYLTDEEFIKKVVTRVINSNANELVNRCKRESGLYKLGEVRK